MLDLILHLYVWKELIIWLATAAAETFDRLALEQFRWWWWWWYWLKLTSDGSFPTETFPTRWVNSNVCGLYSVHLHLQQQCGISFGLGKITLKFYQPGAQKLRLHPVALIAKSSNRFLLHNDIARRWWLVVVDTTMNVGKLWCCGFGR